MFEEEVTAGIALLDKQGPEGWRNKIDVETLDLAYIDKCILGQVYGNYFDGLKVLDVDFDEDNFDSVAPYAFCIYEGSTRQDDYYFRELTLEWVRQLAL